jgi:hypothetical protein
MRLHTITSMRDHVLALQEISTALSRTTSTCCTIAENDWA